MNIRSTTLAATLVTVFTLIGCASTEVSQWAAPPGKEILIGQGGAFNTVQANGKNIDIWVEGSPNRPFKILAKATSTYQYGTADKALAISAAKTQMAEEATKAGGDAVIIGKSATESVGTVYVPGQQTTTFTAVGNNSIQARTSSTPGFAGTTGSGIIHAYIVKYVIVKE